MKNINKLFAIAMLVVAIITAIAAYVFIMDQTSKINDLKLEVAVLTQENENLESDLDSQYEIVISTCAQLHYLMSSAHTLLNSSLMKTLNFYKN